MNRLAELLKLLKQSRGAQSLESAVAKEASLVPSSAQLAPETGFILGEAGEVIPQVSKLPEAPKNLPAIYDDAIPMNAKLADVELPAHPEALSSKWNQFRESAVNNKGKVLAGTGAAALTLGSLREEDQGKSLGAGVTEDTTQQPKPEEIKEIPTEQEKLLEAEIAKLKTPAAAAPADVVPPTSVVDFGEGPSVASMQELRDVQDRANLLNTLAGFRESTSGMAYDIAGLDRPSGIDFKAGANAMRGQAKNLQDQYKERVAFEKEDPNSPQSRGYKELAKAMGFEIKGNASAADIERQFPQLANIYNQREAQAARKEMAAENRAARMQELQLRLASAKDLKQQAKDDKKDKFIQSLRKETGTGALGKMFSNYNTSTRMTRSLEQFAKDPSAYSDYATLMGGLKALQGDESVVREAEVRLGMNATSFGNKMLNWGQRLATGKSLQPEQRAEMVNAARILSEVARNQYKDAIQPILLQAQEVGVDPKLIINEGVTAPSKPVEKFSLPKKGIPIRQAPSIDPSAVDELSDEQVEEELRKRGL